VLHLLAIARDAGVPLTIDDFDAISRTTPLLADLKPGGRFVALDLYKAGGVGVIVKRLLEGGYIDGSAPTVSGRTIAEETALVEETAGQIVVRQLSDPLKPTGGLVILKGSLSPDSLRTN
jgi:dihydroxy-acid dehydratase